ncbi:MAG: nitrophenyl compound nitroreductase subunit ArsF family protein [Candidatus Pacebacteria bacterium]|nr:nitrophenyl compound nitroreductase subunit ArsF family protein [Candidatus Paceibacterota bacterium]
MDKKIITGFAIVLALCASVAAWSGIKYRSSGNMGNQNGEEQSQENSQSESDMVQIYLFHSTRRCSTCIAIGQYAGETVNEFYREEIASGKIEFREINMDLPENKGLTERFQASGSSLYINTIIDGKDNIAEDTNVWRLTGDKTKFKNYLKQKLDNLLGK